MIRNLAIFFLTLFLPFFSLASLTPEVLEGLKNQDPSIKINSLELIEKNKSHDKETIVSLIEALKDPLVYIQSEAMFLLENIGKSAIPYLLKYVESDDRYQKWRIFHLLAKNNVTDIIPLLKENIIKAHEKDDTLLFHALLHALGYIGGAKEVEFIIKNCGNNPMSVMSLSKIMKKDPRLLFKGIHLADPFYEYSEPVAKTIIENLKPSPRTVISLFNEKGPAYQAGALFTLRALNATGRGISPLFEAGLYKPHPAVQLQAIRGIREHQLTTLFPKLLPFIQFQSPHSVQYAALTTILENPDQLAATQKKYLEDEMLTRLKGSDTMPHNSAIETLARLKSKKAFPYLIRKLNDTSISRDTRKALIRYIGHMSPGEAEAMILPLLDQSDVTETVLDTLFELKSKKLAKLLIEKLKNTKTSPHVKHKCIQILGLLSPPPPEAEHAIFPYINVPEFTQTALEALTRLKVPYTESLLISFLTHPDPNIKKFSVQEVGKLKSKKSVNFLVQYLTYGDSDLTNDIIHSLVEIGDKEALLPITLTLLNSKDNTTLKNAMAALSHFKDPSSIRYLKPFLNHANGSIRESAAKIIKSLQ